MHRPAGIIEDAREPRRGASCDTIDELTDEQARTPSRLPDWNRGRGDHASRRATPTGSAAWSRPRRAAKWLAMYPGGVEQRAAGIAAGRDERAAVLLSRSSARVAIACSESWTDVAGRRMGSHRLRVSGEAADARVPVGRGGARSRCITSISTSATSPSDWPVAFVTRVLDEAIATVAARASAARPLVDDVVPDRVDRSRARRGASRCAGRRCGSTGSGRRRTDRRRRRGERLGLRHRRLALRPRPARRRSSRRAI